MDGDHERSLVAWARTFTASFTAGTVPAACFRDFANGDALIPIARTIVGNDNDDGDGSESCVGWAGVFALLQSAGLIEEDAQVPCDEDEKVAMAVTCLEALLRHTVGKHCGGREAFIRQIMSLDADAQTTLRHIIVGEQSQQQDEASSSEAGSPVRDCDSNGSVGGSPAPSATDSTSADSITYEGHDSNHSDEDDLSFKSWYSPYPRESARRQSKIMTGGRTGERAAPVGPKPRQVHTLEMDEAEQGLVGATADSAASFPPAAAGGATDWTATAVEVVDLRAEVSRLRGQLEDAENARDTAVAAVEALRNTAAERQEELNQDLRRARQVAEKLMVAEEDAVIAVERDMRAKHEREMTVLRERASNAEERVLALEALEDEVVRLRDDVDILRPAEAKLSKVEGNLSRCRQKIEELSGLPGQLKREEDAHAQVLDRCLELEAEVAQIPQLKRQVDRYRRSHTDMEVAKREQSRELELAREEVSRLSQEVQALSESSGAAKSEQQRLQEELKGVAMAMEDLDGDGEGEGRGIGRGMTELNPVLTEELARLRRANEQLTAKVDYNTEETIRELEQKADDANRLADSFHENLASERELRAAAEASLAAARARITELEDEIAALREEHLRTVARLEAEAERQAECLRGEMAAAAQAAAAAAATVDAERTKEKAEHRADIEAAVAAAAREEERAAAELVAAQEARAREREKLEGMVDWERKEAARKEAEAARGLVDAKRAFDGEVVLIKKELEARLKEEKRGAAEEVAAARERTSKEEKGRLEESRLKEESKQKVRQLEDELAAGKQAALKAISRLETNARELREESALRRQEQQADHQSKMAALIGEFEQYRATHTVDDISYHHDMDQWEMSIAANKKLMSDLRSQLDALGKDKRRLEREKTYYWGQAEELRMSAAAGGRGDPTTEADRLQLVEQTRELIEENRELRRRAQENDGGGNGGMRTCGGGRWGSSGVAAMRAEHEAEMTALKEEKQDMLLKYHTTSAKLNEQEHRCAELTAEVEEIRAQVVSLELANKRQEKKLRDASAPSAPAAKQAAAINSNGISADDPTMYKENRAAAAAARPHSSSAAKPLRGSSDRHSKIVDTELSLKSVKVSAGGGVSDGNGTGAGTAGKVRAARGPLRGLGNDNARQQQQEESVEVLEEKQAVALEGERVTVGRGDDDGETPPECVQS